MKYFDNIRLNPEIFPENERDNISFQAGALNYPAYLLKTEFRIIKMFKDSYHGEMLQLLPLNTERYHTTLYFRKEDCLLTKEHVYDKNDFNFIQDETKKEYDYKIRTK